MAEVLLFHHAQGLTDGVTHFADTLRATGHAVHTPDLYDGHTFTDLDEGVGYAQATGVPVQVHGKDADPYFAGEGDVDAARELVASTPDAELFLYPGDQHLFADDSLPAYDEPAAKLMTERVLAFLAEVEPIGSRG